MTMTMTMTMAHTAKFRPPQYYNAMQRNQYFQATATFRSNSMAMTITASIDFPSNGNDHRLIWIQQQPLNRIANISRQVATCKQPRRRNNNSNFKLEEEEAHGPESPPPQ